MKFNATILISGKTATGIDKAMSDLRAGRA
jgi:hypothetical protein